MKKLKQIIFSLAILGAPLIALADKITIKEINDMEVPHVEVLPLVSTLLNWFFFALLVVAVFLLINVGYQYVVSGGDSKKASLQAKNLGYILMGIAIALIAKGLVVLTCNIVAGEGTCKFFGS